MEKALLAKDPVMRRQLSLRMTFLETVFVGDQSSKLNRNSSSMDGRAGPT